jgi:pimeloyl-ACP methyl ester carboxylesterase
MQILAEFRHPTRWYSKLIAALLALSFFTLLAASIIAGYVVYRMVAPVGAGSTIDLTNFPGNPENVTYPMPDEEERDGWFFPGLKSAPTILLCPGYQTSRGESLPLASALQDHGYNVFLFDFRGSGPGNQYSTLGFSEVRELRAAMSAVARREDVDRSRFGLWGTNLGGYAAVFVAESDPRVRALSVESVYDQPQDLAAVLVERQGVASLPLLGSFAKKGFFWLHYSERTIPPLSANLSRLAGVSKLFIESREEPSLAASTRALFLLAPDPKEIEVLADGDYSRLLDQGKRDYENRLVSFFLLNLPLEAPSKP